jgi:hypothetical protein
VARARWGLTKTKRPPVVAVPLTSSFGATRR